MQLKITSKKYQQIAPCQHPPVSVLILDLADQIGDWIPYTLTLQTPTATLTFCSENTVLSHTEDIPRLIRGLTKVLESPTDSTFRFEPLEPNFELTLQRVSNNIKLTLWVDHTNYLPESIYGWDGIGVRFYCDEASLSEMIDRLDSHLTP